MFRFTRGHIGRRRILPEIQSNVRRRMQSTHATAQPFPASFTSQIKDHSSPSGNTAPEAPSVFTNTVRHILRSIATPVVVLTTYDYTNGRPMGMTVGSFSSVSLKPPIVSFNIRNPSRFGKVLHSNHITPTNPPDDVLQSTVGINILSHTQAIVSDLFASPQFQYNPTHDPFQSLPHALLSPDCPVPLLQDTVGGFVGSTGKVVTVGDHDVWFVWLTDVWNRSMLKSGTPESGGKPGPKTTPRTPSPLFLKSSRVSDELATEMLDTDLSVHTEPALLYCNRVYRSLSENTSPISTKTDSDSTDDI